MVLKADLPHARQTARDRAVVKDFKMKRPAASKTSSVLKRPLSVGLKRKRDPFTLKRVGSMITGGGEARGVFEAGRMITQWNASFAYARVPAIRRSTSACL